jgi:hypothetical protein
LGGQILTLNGFVNPYSQVKWIFSTKMAQHKALILFKLNSHAKTAPDSSLGNSLGGIKVRVIAKEGIVRPGQGLDRDMVCHDMSPSGYALRIVSQQFSRSP